MGFHAKQSPSLNPASSSPPTNPSAASLPPINPPACGGRLGFSLSWRVFSPACGGVGGGKSGDASWAFGGGRTQRTRTPALTQHEWIFFRSKKVEVRLFHSHHPEYVFEIRLELYTPLPEIHLLVTRPGFSRALVALHHVSQWEFGSFALLQNLLDGEKLHSWDAPCAETLHESETLRLLQS